MSQSKSEQSSVLQSADNPRDRFARYARGRIAHFWRRQILTVIGSAYLTLMTSPYVGLGAGLLALLGELLDCHNLRMQLTALARGTPFATLSSRASVTATVQAITISICILLAWFLPPEGDGAHFALIFLMSAALNAGLVWRYHTPSALGRLIVYGMAFLVMNTHQVFTWDSGIETYLSEAVSMLLMFYIVVIVLQYVIGSHLGSGTGEYLQSLGFKVDFIPQNISNAYKLKAKRIDLWETDQLTAAYASKVAKIELSPSHLDFFTNLRGIGCNPAIPEAIIEKMRSVLHDMYKTGGVERIQHSYMSMP